MVSDTCQGLGTNLSGIQDQGEYYTQNLRFGCLISEYLKKKKGSKTKNKKESQDSTRN